MKFPTTVRRLLWLTVAITYLVVVLGGIVRLSGASLACPDWPLCHGSPLPPPDPLAWMEWIHRLIAFVVGFLVVGLLVWAERHGRAYLWLRRWLWLALPLVILQALLGALVVVLGRPPLVALAHLATGQLFLGAVLLAALSAPGRPREAADGRWAGLTAASVYLLILAGGWVTNGGASAACGDWPLCQGQFLPSTHPLVLIHLLHRLAALLVAGLVFVLWRRARWQDKSAKRLGTALFHLYWLQVLVGGAYILLRYPLWLAALHLALASAIWATSVALWQRLSKAAARAAPA